MMHILFSGMSGNHGGKETYIFGMYRELLNHGVQMDFLATDPEIAFENEIKKNGSKVFHISGRSKGVGQYKRNLEKIFSNNEYDILWAHKTTLSSIEEFDTAKQAGVKIRIIHSHCTKNMGNHFTAFMHAVNRNRIQRVANVFFACSNDAGIYFYKGNIKFHVIRNGFQVDRYKYNPDLEEEIRKELEIGNDFVVGHVGRFSPEKNHKKIISVFEKIYEKNNNSILLLCGDGDEESAVKVLVKEKNLEGQVMFLGVRSDVNRILQCFNVMLFPSLHEGIPYSLLEAQAAGVPCVISANLSDDVIESNAVKKIELVDDDKTWAEFCLKYQGYDKTRTKITLKQHGYDLKIQADKMYAYLSSLLEH